MRLTDHNEALLNSSRCRMPDWIDRREFARRLAIGAAAVPLGACAADAADPPSAAPAVAQKPREPAELPEPKSPPAPADLYLQIIRGLYPDDRLTGRVLGEIRGDVAGDLARSRALSAVRLTNADEPGFVFKPWRAD